MNKGRFAISVWAGGLVAITMAGPAPGEGFTPEALGDMDACLEESATGRDVANTTIVCFNTTRSACEAEELACEADMTEALSRRSAALLARMPVELEGVPDFAKDRYQEILTDIDDGAASLCSDTPAAEMVSCTYRAQALRLAKLRSLGSQLDPRLLIP